MASYARKFVAAGVRLVGGCCGTTPEHIRVMKSALRAGEARTARVQMSAPHPMPSAALGRCRWRSGRGSAQEFAAGEFLTMVEIVPPKGIDIRKEVEGARFLKSVGVDAINIPDSPRASARMSNQALSLLVQQEVGIEAILHYTCRDRNVLGMQSDLLGAAATGHSQSDLHHRRSAEDGQLSRRHGRVRRGRDRPGEHRAQPEPRPRHRRQPDWAGHWFRDRRGRQPGLPNIDEEIRRFEYKVEAGAEYAVTQPVFDLTLLETSCAASSTAGFRSSRASGRWSACAMPNS